MTLHEVLKNTGYDLSLFSEEARRFVENEIFVKTVRGKDKPFITCLKRNKEIALKPEETSALSLQADSRIRLSRKPN